MMQKSPQQAPRTGWEALYDFLNEIFAALIPGGFFISYFFCVAFVLFNSLRIVNDFAANMSGLLTLIIAIVAYCFGALFQRREIKKVDSKSARHIYRKMPHSSGHTFAFANALTNEYITRLVRILQLHAILERQECCLLEEKKEKSCKICTDCVLNRLILSLRAALPVFSGEEDSLSLTKEECFCILLRMLMLDSARPHCVKTEREALEIKLKKLDARLCHKHPRTLKQIVEKAVWDEIAVQFAATFPEPGNARGFCHDVLYSWRVRPFLGKTWKGRFANNLKTLKVLHRRLEQTLKDHTEDPLYTFVSRLEEYTRADINGTIDWPYTHMYRYCLDRGLEYAECVNWGDKEVTVGVLDDLGLTSDVCMSDEINRSKSRINTDKMDIAEKEPLLYRSVNKNEAHIRFMNSIWYASAILLKVSVILGIAAIAAAFFPRLFPQYAAYAPGPLKLFYMELVSIAYALICLYIRHSVKESFHYQRVREINMILKAKYIIADKEKKGRDKAKTAA